MLNSNRRTPKIVNIHYYEKEDINNLPNFTSLNNEDLKITKKDVD